MSPNHPDYLHRISEATFRETAEAMRIVLVSGPRQCGKTTLLRAMLTEEDLFLSMDNPGLLSAAAADPEGFLRPYLGAYRRIAIDEIQKTPKLLGVLKLIADEDRRPGRFLISGSSDYHALPGANESLAGRLGEIPLRTLTAAEIRSDPSADRIARWRVGDFGPLTYDASDCSKLVVLEKALTGGYPEVLRLSPRARTVWFRNYVARLLEHDLKDLGSFEKLPVADRLLRHIALNSGHPLNLTEQARTYGVTLPTVRRYLSALQTMYLVSEVPSWAKKPLHRLSNAPCLYLNDTGLMSFCCGHSVTTDTLTSWALNNPKASADFIGNLIETWVCNQLFPICEADGWRIYHLRIAQRQEIDFVLENDLGQMMLIEVKASESVSSDDFRHIRWFAEQNPDTVLGGIVLYCGQSVRSFGENLRAVPMAALWN